MTITVFGATGQVGKRVLQLALAKGYPIKAFTRDITTLLDEESRDKQLKAIKGSVFNGEDIFNAIKDADAVISVLGGGFDGVDKTRSLGMKNIVAQMQNAGVSRIVALGGSGVLDDGSGDYILNSPDYPSEYLPVGKEHLLAYEVLKQSPLKWTFVCAPTILNEDGSAQYIIQDEVPPHPNKNMVAAGDIADFMVNEIEQNQHIQHRVGISAL